jgi:predicted PurR-regulated permease PerM
MTAIIAVLFVLMIMAIILGIFVISKLTNLIYDIEEQIDESLEIIDSSYKEIGKVLETPVFYDDPFIKQTLSSIKKTHSGLLLIANKISNPLEKKDKEE